MPRQARLDAPGFLQYVFAKGIEGREIFKNNDDYLFFLNRLSTILQETRTQSYAWALLPEHFLLLLRTGLTPLKKIMRRLSSEID